MFYFGGWIISFTGFYQNEYVSHLKKRQSIMVFFFKVKNVPLKCYLNFLNEIES